MTVRADPLTLEERLRDIQAITDAALSHLDDRAFLAQLLARTRDILGTDSAALLLLDGSSKQLIATAAAGLEEEVRQGVLIPVGRGFAGRIAAERRPVILDRVDHTTVLNPILWAKGIQSMMGVPLVAGGRVIGVLHVGALDRREFTSQDTELLQMAADRAAVAVQSMMAQTDRIAATALQRSLLPSALPVVDGAKMAARYVPGSGVVGGDWYDVFSLPAGELCMVIGDVAGSGLHAAVIMGRMRSALRAYALETNDPAEVLSRLGLQLTPRKARQIVRAFAELPRELSAEMDEHQVALHTRIRFAQLRQGRERADIAESDGRFVHVASGSPRRPAAS